MRKARLWGFVLIAMMLGLAMAACGEGPDEKGTKTEYWNVTWRLNSGEWPAGFTPVTKVEKNTSLTKPSDPVNGDRPFIGWFSNAALTNGYDFSNKVTANITLYAKWGGGEFSISVTGGTADKESAVQGETITLTPDEEEGMVFLGWIIDPSTVTMTSANQFIMPAADVTVTGTFEPKGTGDVPYHITNNLAQDSSSGFLVQWHNAVTVATQTLQVVKATESFDQAEGIEVTGTLFDVTGVTTCPSTNGTCSSAACTGYGNYAARNIFKYAVTGLDPATMYKYRMGEPGSWSEPYYCLTSDASFKEFSFTVVTDTQDNVFEGMTLTLRAANEYDPDHRFFIHAGDVVDFIGLNPSEIVNYTDKATEFIKYKPIATTQGNHDTYHNKSGDQYVFGEATIFNAFTTFPDNGFSQEGSANHSAGRSNSYYFYYNEVLIVVLNTMATQSATGTAEPNHTAQQTWLRKVLQDDKNGNLSKFRIVFSHVPPFAGRGNTSDAEPWLMANVRSAYTPICTEFEVDIFFAGHDHVYGRSQPIKITSSNTTLSGIATANPGEGNAFGPTAGGVIYSIVGSTGPKTYAFRNTNLATNQFIPRAYSAVLLDQNGTYADALAGGTPAGPSFSPGLFVNVKVTEEKLIVNAVRRDGITLDTYEVRRKDLPPEPVQDIIVSSKAILGVTPPVSGATAVTTITANNQYQGTVSWSPALDGGKFAPETTYTATITLTARTGFTLEGVEADFFTVAGATDVNNPINSGVITAVFPATGEAPVIPSEKVIYDLLTDDLTLFSGSAGGATHSVYPFITWNGGTGSAITNDPVAKTVTYSGRGGSSQGIRIALNALSTLTNPNHSYKIEYWGKLSASGQGRFRLESGNNPTASNPVGTPPATGNVLALATATAADEEFYLHYTITAAEITGLISGTSTTISVGDTGGVNTIIYTGLKITEFAP